MSAALLQKTASSRNGLPAWIPGCSLVFLALLMMPGCGGSSTPEPTGTSTETASGAGDSGSAGGAAPKTDTSGGTTGGSMMMADTSEMMQSDDGDDDEIGGLNGDPSAQFGEGYGDGDGEANDPTGLGAGGPEMAELENGGGDDPADSTLGGPGGPGGAGNNGTGPKGDGDPDGTGLGAGGLGAGYGEAPTGDGDGGGGGLLGGGPGGPGGEGYGGEGGEGGGRRQPQAPKEGSPQYPAYHLVLGLMEGKAEGLAKHIGKRVTGTLASIKSGKLSEKEATELKATFAKPELIGSRRVGTGTQLSLRSGEKVIQLIIRKEGEAFKVTEMKILKGSKRKRR